MPKQLNNDAEAYDKEYNSFLKQLDEFHQHRATPFKRLPKINGKGIDLYLLYVLVTARGGWQKVNIRNEWDEILEEFHLPSTFVNSATALKHIYIRYLDVYERVNYLGEDCDERSNDPDEDESRSLRQKRSVRAVNIVPQSYNHQIHNVSDTARISCGMSTSLFESSIYDKLALGLSCPLPNEHDFAFNMCTLLSNEGKHTLQLSQCPRLLEFMLSHTGVFKDRETQRYFIGNYKNAKGKSLIRFWLDSVNDKAVLDLLNPENVEADLGHNPDLPKKQVINGEPANVTDSVDIDLEFPLSSYNSHNYLSVRAKLLSHDQSCIFLLKNSSSDSRSFDERGLISCLESEQKFSMNNNDEIFKCDSIDLRLNAGDEEIFHLGRDLGLMDSEGTRIAQILHILRNLSFEESNIPVLAHSETCLRFLLLCVCSRWGGLSVGALDTLGNISMEILLRDPVSDPTSALLLSTVCQGVSSQDRSVVLRSLEVLNKLAMNDSNEEILSNNIEQEVYNQICRFLAIHDIMLLIYTLEALYSLSSLGSSPCNCIVRSKGCVQTLISLLTVEAQSYGPEACIGMKVVETVTGVVNENQNESLSYSTTATTSTTSFALGSISSVSTVTSVLAIPSSTVIDHHSVSNSMQSQSSTSLTYSSQAISSTPKIAIKPAEISKRVVPVEVEEFVTNWVAKNYDACPTNAIEQAIVYRHFAASMHALGRKQGLNPVLLSNCVRKVFGTSVGPCRRQVEDGSEKWHYNGIRRKDGILVPPLMAEKKNVLVSSNNVLVATPVISSSSSIIPHKSIAAPPPTQTNSILKAQLSAPLRHMSPIKVAQHQGTTTTTAIAGIIASPISASSSSGFTGGEGLLHSRCSTPPQTAAVPRTDNSSLIKSLLANKITRAIPKKDSSETKSPIDEGVDGIVKSLPPFNGIISELSRCGSIVTSDSVESKKVITFEGILQNGVKEMEKPRLFLKDDSKKNLLADLLEKTVGGDILNGVVDKDLRISEKITLPSFNQTPQFAARVNGPLTSNGQLDFSNQGIKRPATSDSLVPVKRLAVEDSRVGSDGKVMIYVSQNGAETQVLTNSNSNTFNQRSSGQLVSVTQVGNFANITSNQSPQQMFIKAGSQGNIMVQSTSVSQSAPNQILPSKLHQTTPESVSFPSQSQIPRSTSQNIATGQTQIVSAQNQQCSVLSSSGSEVIQQVVTHNQASQKVILHGTQLGQMITGHVLVPQSGQNIIMQTPNNLQGQVIMQGVNVSSGNQSPLIVQGSNNQVLVQSSSTNQSPVLIQGSSSHGQLVVSGVNPGQTVVNAAGQAMILAGTHGQVVMAGGQPSGQHVVVGNNSTSQSQMLLPSGGNAAVLLSPQQTPHQGSQKTLIILPNPKVVNSNVSSQSNPVVLSRQMVQVVSSSISNSTNSSIRTTVVANSLPFSSVSNVGSTQVSTVSTSTNPSHSVVHRVSTSVVPTLNSTAASGPHIPAPQVLASGVVRRTKPSSTGLKYLCEWRGCNQIFPSPGLVYHHACKVHCPPHITELTCQWAGCDSMIRKRFSTMTHIHDRHCNEQLLQILAIRRQQISSVGKTDIPVPQTPPSHPGYAPNAAYHAIKRHSLEVINHRDLVEKEGPVTKSIRLTAALILRNLVIYSTSGKTLLRGYEAELSNVAISHMEASRTVSQILYDIHLGDQAL